MSDEDLPKVSEYLLAKLYKQYVENTKQGFPMLKSKDLGSFKDIQENIVPEIKLENVADLIRSLDTHGYLQVQYGDNYPMFVSLTDKAIVRYEQQLGLNISKIADFVGKLAPFIKFL